ncbi:hypothetical protein [Neptuniibacter caesariensis]|nr:hypothetical protein [Neptuniibacter caesariensis]
MRVLDNMEKWALDLLSPFLISEFPNGYEVVVPNQDPPDCIATNGKKSLPIEFTAFDTWEVFKFYNSDFKKRKEPFYSILQIPYEPEKWIMSVMERKSYALEDKFKDLTIVTHFHGGLEFQNAEPQEIVSKTSAIGLTHDLLQRMSWALWNSKYRNVETFLVYPGQNPIKLNVPVEEPSEIDITNGYPTIQTIIGKFPLNQVIDFEKLERMEVKFFPKSQGWVQPDSLRGGPIDPFTIQAEPKDTDALAWAFVAPSMPMYNELDLRQIAEAQKHNKSKHSESASGASV